MSLKKKVISKGYTLEITSWENDADHSKTMNKTVDTFEEAKHLHQICTTLFKSKNNGQGGVGNSMDKEKLDHIIEYYTDNSELFESIPCFQEFKQEFPIIDVNDENCAEAIWYLFIDWAGELIGYSDFYDFRVCESCIVTYSPEDIYLEEIKF